MIREFQQRHNGWIVSRQPYAKSKQAYAGDLERESMNNIKDWAWIYFFTNVNITS